MNGSARPAGHRPGATVLGAGVRLNPQMLSLAASIGCATLPVYRRLRVSPVLPPVMSWVMPGEPLRGCHPAPNRVLRRACSRRSAAGVRDLDIVPDSLGESHRQALRKRSSRQRPDRHQRRRVDGRGGSHQPASRPKGTLDSWLIAMKPGKPVAFGRSR